MKYKSLLLSRFFLPALAWVAPCAHGAVTVSFANSGTGFGPTPSYVIADLNTDTITLGFSIGATGTVSLAASTDATSSVIVDAINEWDNANVGTVSDAAFFSQSFTLVGSATGGGGKFTISELDGGGIGVQGENSNRIDGSDLSTAPEAAF